MDIKEKSEYQLNQQLTFKDIKLGDVFISDNSRYFYYLKVSETQAFNLSTNTLFTFKDYGYLNVIPTTLIVDK